MTQRFTPEALDMLYRNYPEVFETWAQGKRELIAQEPRDPYGRGQSDRDLDRRRRETPGIVIYDEPPLEDVSNAQAVLQGDQQQQICRVKYRACQELTAVVRVFPPQDGSFAVASGAGNVTVTDSTNPFNNIGTSATFLPVLPATLQQMVEVIGYLTASHQNNQMIIPFNMPLGQLVRVQHVGSRFDVAARLACRYTPKLGAGSIFSWLVPPTGSNFDRCAAFDNPPALSLFASQELQRPLLVQGFCGKAFTSPVPPSRIFFGWIDPLAVQNTQHLCPVPRGAQTVILMCDITNVNNDPGAGAAFAGVRMQFNMICQSPGAATTRRMLNFPSGTTVPLRSDCVAIEVVNVDSPPAGQAIPFELQFDVGF
jgi:hypothetical protein